MTLMHEGKHAYDYTHGVSDARYIDPSDGVPLDIGKQASEHAAIGIGRYRREPMTENGWRAEQETLKIAGRFSAASMALRYCGCTANIARRLPHRQTYKIRKTSVVFEPESRSTTSSSRCQI